MRRCAACMRAIAFMIRCAAWRLWSMDRARGIRSTESVLEEVYSEIPPEWYEFEPEGIERMLGQLLRRRKLVRRTDCFGLEIVGAAVSELEVNHANRIEESRAKTLEPKSTLRYRILRYTPDLVRDEWVNIGVLLEETTRLAPRPAPD